jgi:beta-lactamase superfamily II metal-dependent hydrolase
MIMKRFFLLNSSLAASDFPSRIRCFQKCANSAKTSYEQFNTMPAKHALNVDLAKVFDARKPKSAVTILMWGDLVEVAGDAADGRIPVHAFRFSEKSDGSILPETVEAFIRIPKGKEPGDVLIAAKDSRVLKVNFVDVQQGDGCVIETPERRVILVDGGDNQMFARYLAARFRGTSATRPQEIDAIVVTHGDADHFAGLTEIHASETNANPAKRLFIHPERIFHNGVFKRPGEKPNGKKRTDLELLNDTVKRDGVVYLSPLIDDPSALPEADLNKPFKEWKEAIEAWKGRGDIAVRRLQLGDHDAFDFLGEEGIKVEVLGPLTEEVGGKSALRFLGDPPKGPRLGHEIFSMTEESFKGHSASHTINGHSIVLRLTYGGFSFLLTGDLNDQSGRILTRAHSEGKIDLSAEVLKAPHHGSADFSPAFIKAVSPIISVISSGDESEQKEYIHPRATLVGALGRYSQAPEPLIFCTELVAFFKRIGWSYKDKNQRSGALSGDVEVDEKQNRFYGFQRTAYGMVKIRSDGERLLVSTNSGKDDMKEAYAYQRDKHGQPVADPVVII